MSRRRREARRRMSSRAADRDRDAARRDGRRPVVVPATDGMSACPSGLPTPETQFRRDTVLRQCACSGTRSSRSRSTRAHPWAAASDRNRRPPCPAGRAPIAFPRGSRRATAPSRSGGRRSPASAVRPPRRSIRTPGFGDLRGAFGHFVDHSVGTRHSHFALARLHERRWCFRGHVYRPPAITSATS